MSNRNSTARKHRATLSQPPAGESGKGGVPAADIHRNRRPEAHPSAFPGSAAAQGTTADAGGAARGEHMRLVEPKSGRAEAEVDIGDPVRLADDEDRFTRPPLRGKATPHRDMGNVTPTLDDPRRDYHHHPNDPATTDFDVDPDAADAAADLAGDLGAQFLEGATMVEDMSERAIIDADASEEAELPYLFEESMEEDELEDLEPPDAEDPEEVRADRAYQGEDRDDPAPAERGRRAEAIPPPPSPSGRPPPARRRGA